MKITKNSLLILAVAMTALFGSCSKDGETPKLPEFGDITLHKATVGVKQLLIATCKPIGTDTLNITYAWSTSNGTIKGKQTTSCNWIPAQKGASTLTVTMDRNGKKMSKSISVNVRECDFEYAMWGDHVADVLMNEILNGSDKPTIDVSNNGKIAFIYKRSGAIAGYITDNNLLVGGLRITTSSSYNLNDYVKEYDTEVARLTALYGTPSETTLKWGVKPDYSADINKWGLEIRKGNLELLTIFNTETTKIEVSCKLQSSYEIRTSSFFFRKGSSASSIASNAIRAVLEKRLED